LFCPGAPLFEVGRRWWRCRRGGVMSEPGVPVPGCSGSRSWPAGSCWMGVGESPVLSAEGAVLTVPVDVSAASPGVCTVHRFASSVLVIRTEFPHVQQLGRSWVDSAI